MKKPFMNIFFILAISSARYLVFERMNAV
ncbi:MAG: hypothetical protein QG557_90, partial [Pseudomonadota bacterium]|nr:hypothetical protein [Pseudomonadota bacterium]